MDTITRITIFLAAVWLGFLICSLAHAEESHETEARAACRHILSPAMATDHPEFERQLFERCVELQRKVPWRLTDGQF